MPKAFTVVALADTFGDIMNTAITIRTLSNQKNISQEEKIAIGVKKLIESIWSVFYWTTFLLLFKHSSKSLQKYRIPIVGTHPHGEQALRRISSVFSAIISVILNDAIKPYVSSLMTSNVLDNLHKHPNQDIFIMKVLRLFGYKEKNE